MGKRLPFGQRIKIGFQQWLAALPFIVAGLILMGMFTIYPLVRNIQISISDYNIIANKTGGFLGIQNYIRMFLDPDWLRSLRNTLLYALVTVPGQMFFGLLLAVLINSVTKAKTMFKVITYLPVITSWVVASLVFKYIFASGNGGLINYIFMQLHFIETPVAWLQNEWTANVVLWIFGIWKGTGWTMIIYLAALQGVSQTIYEAASIDGAGSIAKFFRITIPLVKNTTLYLLTVLTIGAFGAYIHVMMITNGAPLGRTQELMNYMYNTAFTNYDFSYAAAQAVVIGVIVFLISLVQRKLSKETVN
ncbi:carbohydrate ABC transporter permease [Diplocloster agilis]|uniref:carbohydrate ABC transporter permease n=1 Tax=Diplocloster agilis TaxID=2850323 RepID=UPI000821B094|nr:sugar ABC transporter permease [Suonthocola fibrivorans]MCU6732590.1 sugar ABC transporter permease [Suonthocola fibrivorans]SCI54020.1 Inner membrane ABC transporter permease protein ycjO [uncultured Clostridium sp.]